MADQLLRRLVSNTSAAAGLASATSPAGTAGSRATVGSAVIACRGNEHHINKRLTVDSRDSSPRYRDKNEGSFCAKYCARVRAAYQQEERVLCCRYLETEYRTLPYTLPKSRLLLFGQLPRKQELDILCRQLPKKAKHAVWFPCKTVAFHSPDER